MHVGLGWVGRWVGRGSEGRQTCEAEVAVAVLMPCMRGRADVSAFHHTSVRLMTAWCDYSGLATVT